MTASGIVRTDYGWRAFVRVRGTLYSKRFPPDASITELKDWRASTRTDVLRAAIIAPSVGTFAADADAYLLAVKTMPTYAWRETDILFWVGALGADRQRNSIRSSEIRTILHECRLSGQKNGKPLAESSCNHRRTALMHFYTVLNGKSGYNPVRDVPKFREPDPVPRGLPFAKLAKVFATMEDTKTKARIMVMALTGLPHATLMRLTRDALDTRAKTIIVPRRRKGSGTKTRVLPLTPEALAAFKMLDRYDGWGRFSQSSLQRSLHRACRTAKVTLIRGYDLRHSFGTAVYEQTSDIRAAQALLDHSDVKLTERYTLSAVAGQMRKALNSTRKVTSAVTSRKKRS